MPLELYGTRDCPYTADLREELTWQGKTFVEYDLTSDPAALERFRALTPGNHTVPVLADGDRVLQIGYRGRGCFVGLD